MSRRERAQICVVFGSVTGFMRFLGTYPYHVVFGGCQGEQERGSSPEVPDPGNGGSRIGGCQAGCTQFPTGVAGAGCQEQHLTHPRAVISHTQLLPASGIWKSQQGMARLQTPGQGEVTPNQLLGKGK